MALDFFAGSVGGCAGVIIGHPLDTIKVHIQNPRSTPYKGTFDCMRKLYARDGIRAFYRGLTSPLAAVAGLNAIVFGIYGHTQKSFTNPNALRSHFLAGGCAGFFQGFLATPMELVKIRVQVSNSSMGPFQTMQNIHSSEGIRGLFRGLHMSILRDIPGFAMYFLTYEYLARSHNGELARTSKLLMAGGFAGVVSWTVSYPFDVIKCRVQCDGMDGVVKYNGMIDCLRKSIHNEGHAVLWRGLTPTLLRAFPVNATVFTVVTWTIRLVEGFEIDVIVLPA